MDIKILKKVVTEKINQLNDISLLEEIGWLLENDVENDPKFMKSFKQGLDEADKGLGQAHSKVRLKYSKWL